MAQTKVIQVTNVAPAATKEQMQTLFSFLGKIDEIKLYPEDISVPVTSKVCYVKYDDPTNCGVAQHLTNTVFIDRALIVVPCQDGVIPDEAKALQLAAPANAVAGMIPGGGAPAASALLPTPAPIANPLLAAAGVGGEVLGATLADQDILGAFFPESVSKDVLGSGMGDQPGPGGAAGAGLGPQYDPALAALGLPQPPPLPGNVDPSKIEEIRRTIYVGNLDSATVTAEQLLNFFQQVGEVKYVRMAGDETQPTRFAFVEFADQTSVAKALQYNGIMFGNRPLKVNYSNIALNKPVALTNPHVAQIDAVLNQVREAQSHISSALNAGTMTAATLLQIPTIEVSEKKEDKRRRSRSRSRSYSRRRRSRSRSPRRSRSRRSRSRSRHRRSRSRSPKRRSRSPRRRRSRSRERRSRSRSRRSPSKSPARRHSTTAKGRRRSRSRTPPRSYRTTSRLSRSKSRSPRRRSRSPKRSPSKSPARRPSSSKHKKEKKKDKDKDRDRSGSRERDTTKSKKKKKDKDKDKDRDREKDKEKHRGKSKEQEEDKKEAKVTRDYDEEEQGYDSEKEKVSKPPAPEAAVEQSVEAPPSSDDVGDSGSQGQADMEMDSD
ncbi:uncharacterized protein LOC144903619 isoform X5 [Branchiostoma floridae x Branchiostoma belcheri]